MQKIKQILSGAVGLLMTGATLMTPALANFTLDNFNTMTAANTVVVVGTDAKAMDIVGAINVGAAIAQNGATAAAGASASVEGAEQKDVDLTSNLVPTFSTLDDGDLAGFVDSKIRWDSNDVDVAETLKVTKVQVQTSATDKDFGEDVYLGTSGSDGIQYIYTIDDADLNISAVTENKPLEITFLGKALKITDIGQDEITVEEGEEAALGIGGTVTVNGKEVEIISIGQNAVSLKVGTITKIVQTTDGEVEVGSTGVKVKVESILYTDDTASRQALLKVGSDLATTIKNSPTEAMEMFGEPEETTDAMWVWGIEANETADLNKVVIKAVHNQQLNSDTEAVVGVGESLTLPNDYASITLDKLTTDADRKYTVSVVEGLKVNLNEGGVSTGSYTDVDGLKITSNVDNKGLYVNVSGESKETNTVYIFDQDGTGTNTTMAGAFENKDGKVQIFDLGADGLENFNITYDVTNLIVTPKNDSNSGIVTEFITIDDVDGPSTSSNFTVDFDITKLSLGITVEDDDGGEINYNAVPKGTKEDGFRTPYGIVVESPKDNAANDEVVFRVPQEKVQAQVTVSGPTGATIVGGESDVTQVDLGNGIAKLASEAEADKSVKNLVLMGGPYANSLVEELAVAGKTPTKAQWGDLTGKAIIQAIDGAFVNGKAAIVVAGYDAEQTRSAALKLMAGDLTGGMVEVVDGTATATTYTAEADVVDDAADVIDPINATN